MMVSKPCISACTAPTPCPTYGAVETFSTNGTAATVPSVYGPWFGDTTTAIFNAGIVCSPAGPRDPGGSHHSIIYVKDPCLDYCAKATAVQGVDGYAGVAFRQCDCPAGSNLSSSGLKWDWVTGADALYGFDCNGNFTNYYLNIIGGPAPAGTVYEVAICGNNISLIKNGVIMTTLNLSVNSTCTGRGIIASDPNANRSCTDNFAYINNCPGEQCCQ